MAASPFWLTPKPLLLASASRARRTLLVAAGVPVEVGPVRIDERGLEAAARAAGAGAAEVALHLAREKALAVSRARPDRLVLGADQTLDCEGMSFNKPRDAAGARDQIAALAGRTHRLHSAAVLARAGACVADAAASAALTMRRLDAAFIARYVEALGPAAIASVGTYQIEALGVHLFERIEGDHFTILGLPLVPLLALLRAEGCLAG